MSQASGRGLWQGFILLFTFFISLFNHNVGIYEIHNNGGWYNFGYLLGVMTFWGGSGGGARTRLQAEVAARAAVFRPVRG